MVRGFREHAFEVATALEVDERETQRSAGDAPNDPHHVVGDAEALGVGLDAGSDLGRDGDEQHLGEEHRLHHAGAEPFLPEA